MVQIKLKIFPADLHKGFVCMVTYMKQQCLMASFLIIHKCYVSYRLHTSIEAYFLGGKALGQRSCSR